MLNTCLVMKDGDLIEQLPALLGSRDNDVSVCHDGNLALALIARQHFDGIFVDWDGLNTAAQLVGAIRQSNSHHGTVCCAVTGNHKVEMEAFRAGATLVLSRPLSADRSRKTLEIARRLMLRERRRSYRQNALFGIRLRTPEREMNGTSVNISEGGMCVCFPELLVPGQPVQLQFQLPEHSMQHSISARVIWSAGERAGLEFVTVSRLSRAVLTDWLAEQFLKQLPAGIAASGCN